MLQLENVNVLLLSHISMENIALIVMVISILMKILKNVNTAQLELLGMLTLKLANDYIFLRRVFIKFLSKTIIFLIISKYKIEGFF